MGRHRRYRRRAWGPPTVSSPRPIISAKASDELPDTIGWARPIAVTGQIGYQIPTTSFDVGQGTFIPQVLVYGGSLQYSMPYLKSEVKDLQLPDLINHLIPIVEVQFATPVANNLGNSFVTTGTINPGVIWVGSYFQVGFEAVIPVNAMSGSGVGFLGQLHLYLDDIFPKTFGQPLIGGFVDHPTPAYVLRNRPCEQASLLPYSCLRLGGRSLRGRPRLSRSCESAGRQHGRRCAARGLAVVHAKHRAGFQLRAGYRRQGCARRSGQSANQRQHYAHRPEIPGARRLQGSLASALRGHPQNARSFSFQVGGP